MDDESKKNLGSPNLKLMGLQIWIHGRQFPDSSDFWDGNWLRITAHCGGDGASVFVNGPIIHLSELKKWGVETEKLIATLEGEATLDCIEPNISVVLTAISLGHIRMEVSITPDHLSQRHNFTFDIDQTYLPSLVKSCRDILTAYPIKELPDNIR